MVIAPLGRTTGTSSCLPIEGSSANTKSMMIENSTGKLTATSEHLKPEVAEKNNVESVTGPDDKTETCKISILWAVAELG